MMRSIKPLFAASILSLSSIPAVARVEGHDLNPGEWVLDVRGVITPEDAAKVAAMRKTHGRIVSSEIWGSEGGDVQAAMQIGRMLRSDETQISIATKCASACVLLYVGAVSRIGLDDGQLGIHRPIGQVAAINYSAQKVEVDARNKAIESYLVEMNVSPRLLEAMNAVPSYKIRYLGRDEVEAFGIVSFDPVYAEQQAGAQAKRLGITTLELQRRISERERRCDPMPSGNDPAAPAYQAKVQCVRALGLVD